MKYKTFKALLSEYTAEGGFEAVEVQPRKKDSPLWEYPVLPVSSYKIQKQYEAAIGRHSSYRCNLRRHIQATEFGVKVWCTDHKNVLVGFSIKDVFVASHFAPESLRGGYGMLQDILYSEHPVVFAVLPFMAKQLAKMGYRELGYIPQWWQGQMVMKTIMVNDAFTEEDADLLVAYYQERA